MISLERDSRLPLGEQLVRQLRYEIASGHYSVGERLPSTRTLGTQLGISFHTVRKAYRQLVENGLVDVIGGSGFVVSEPRAVPHSERLEQGAAVAGKAIRQLVSFGLAEQDIENLLLEKLEQAFEDAATPEILFAAPYPELAERCSELLESTISMPVTPVLLANLDHYPDADYVITPFASLQTAIKAVPGSHVMGITVYYAYDLQETLARMMTHNAVGIATNDPSSVEPIMIDIRRQTGFSGQVFGLSVQAGANEFKSLLAQVDILLYTHQSRRRVFARIGDHPSIELDPQIAPESLHVVRRTFGGAG